MISTIGLLCLAVGIGAMFVSRHMGLTLIAVYLVTWIFLNFPMVSKGGKIKTGEGERKVTLPQALELIVRERDRAPPGKVVRSLAGISLGTSVDELEENSSWKELREQERKPLQPGLHEGERVFGSLDMNLLAGILDRKVWKVSLAWKQDEQARHLIQRLHDLHGTEWGEEDGRVVWEDGSTRLEALLMGDKVNLVLSDLECCGRGRGKGHSFEK